MKDNSRKTLIAAIEGVGVSEFASNEEMIAARTLHSMMVENSSNEKPKRKRRKKVDVAELA